MVMVLSNRDFALQASADAHKAHSALQLNQIVRRYSGGRGLGPVSLNVNWGQVCSVIGANGSGKTTLLRCIGLFEPLNSGSIELSGKAWSAANAVSQITDEERGSLLGIVFQHAEPWPHLSILDNVKLPLIHVARLSPQESRERAEQELERFGLADRAKALSHQLSGGMRQRVALARTFALRPKLLLLDEATSALDPEWSERVRQIMRGFADAGGAIISISHRLNFVRRLSDWVIYLSNGQIVEEGAPHSILDNPRDTGLQMFLENA